MESYHFKQAEYLKLPLFSRLENPTEAIEALLKIYGNDMQLFGYKYEIRQDGVYATCENYDLYGRCCWHLLK